MIKIALSIYTLSFILLLSSCAKPTQPTNDDTVNKQKEIAIALPVAHATSDFAFDFFKTLQKDKVADAKENIFVSPLSLHIALGMLVNGATQETKTEILNALKAKNISLEDLNTAYKTLLSELPNADPKVKLAIANAVFYKNNFNFFNTYLTDIKNKFNAQVTGLPFAPSDLPIINKWASDHTNGKINKVLDEISPDLVMLLMNALYFKGDWAYPFETNATNDAIFNLESDSKSIKMMHQTNDFRYNTNTDFSAIQMPYGNGQFRATFILPHEGKSVKNIIQNLNTTQWNDLLQNFISKEVQVSIPKFKLEQEFSLNQTMKSMGMLRAFKADEAQFKNITNNDLFVSFIKQNTFLAVDEIGTEAAAVTTIGMETTSAPAMPVFFNCNRPFIFIISEKTSNTILFIGRIMNPTN